jgi:hypothetical protein
MTRAIVAISVFVVLFVAAELAMRHFFPSDTK